MAYLNDLISH